MIRPALKLQLRRTSDAKPEKADKAEKADKKAAFATHLFHAQALMQQPALPVPHAPVAKAAKAPAAPRIEAPQLQKPSPAEERFAPRAEPIEPSRREPFPGFTAAEPAAQPTGNAVRVDPAPPAWMPHDAAIDETARLALFPHSVQWASDQGALQLAVRGTEVSLRAQGELGASLKASEAELRVALAQQGLTLRETASTGTESGSAHDEREQQRPREETQEWT